MKTALAILVVLLTTACHHAPVATAPTRARYALPSEAKPDDLFCAPPSLFDSTTSDEALGLVCTTVQQVREWLRARRYAWEP